jgi:uncharacterized protein YdeI (YjbR/CyaY-like superfamily)
MEKTEELHFVNRRDWRSWLEKNHEAKKEAWLIFCKKHTGKPNISYDEAVEEAICFGWIDSIAKRIDDEKFTRKFTPRKPNSEWAESNKKRATKMINEGKMTRAGLELVMQAKIVANGTKLILSERASSSQDTSRELSNRMKKPRTASTG